jgi:hypothetical protein
MHHVKTVLRHTVLVPAISLCALGAARAAQPDTSQPNTAIGIDPYYTGSLLSPSPAISTQGLLAFEPYVIYTRNPGAFGPRGGLTPSTNEATALQTFTLIKYAITDRLSIEALP